MQRLFLSTVLVVASLLSACSEAELAAVNEALARHNAETACASSGGSMRSDGYGGFYCHYYSVPSTGRSTSAPCAEVAADGTCATTVRECVARNPGTRGCNIAQ